MEFCSAVPHFRFSSGASPHRLKVQGYILYVRLLFLWQAHGGQIEISVFKHMDTGWGLPSRRRGPV